MATAIRIEALVWLLDLHSFPGGDDWANASIIVREQYVELPGPGDLEMFSGFPRYEVLKMLRIVFAPTYILRRTVKIPF